MKDKYIIRKKKPNPPNNHIVEQKLPSPGANEKKT